MPSPSDPAGCKNTQTGRAVSGVIVDFQWVLTYEVMENIHLEKVPQVSVYHSCGVCAKSCCHAMKQGADKELKQTTHTGCSDPRLDFQRGEGKKKHLQHL